MTADLGDKVKKLGTTLTEEFNIAATISFTDTAAMEKLQALGAQAETLQNELAASFGVKVGEPLETLREILAKAEAQKLPGTSELKKAVEQLAIMKADLPENACPTEDGLKQAASKAVKPPRP